MGRSANHRESIGRFQFRKPPLPTVYDSANYGEDVRETDDEWMTVMVSNRSARKDTGPALVIGELRVVR